MHHQSAQIIDRSSIVTVISTNAMSSLKTQRYSEKKLHLNILYSGNLLTPTNIRPIIIGIAITGQNAARETISKLCKIKLRLGLNELLMPSMTCLLTYLVTYLFD